MAQGAPPRSDEQLERVMGRLLQAGVLLSAAVVLAGGLLYLHRYGPTSPHYEVFNGEPSDLCSVRGILRDAAFLHSRGLIQLGVLLLVATPVARVLFSLAAFILRRDAIYVAATLIVLLVLLYGLAGGPV